MRDNKNTTSRPVIRPSMRATSKMNIKRAAQANRASQSATAKKQASSPTSRVTKKPAGYSQATPAPKTYSVSSRQAEDKVVAKRKSKQATDWSISQSDKKSSTMAKQGRQASASRVSDSKEAGMIRSSKAKSAAASAKSTSNTKSSAAFAKADSARRSVAGVRGSSRRSVTTRQAEDKVVSDRKSRMKNSYKGMK